ncbi:hypothetical protein C2845_PM01G32210 [Panicum miliaceum]|uniref:Uncharacterized protein n=1 Tax=Panicum miliaceum TaxID=4540 RepID=A0A3L6TQ76_PANMI|nr:hypothetical protein C2845_PM01G32210 [Panicum miliaceum]
MGSSVVRRRAGNFHDCRSRNRPRGHRRHDLIGSRGPRRPSAPPPSAAAAIAAIAVATSAAAALGGRILSAPPPSQPPHRQPRPSAGGDLGAAALATVAIAAIAVATSAAATRRAETLGAAAIVALAVAISAAAAIAATRVTDPQTVSSKELKLQRERIRNASMTDEQRNERNKKRREGYRRKKLDAAKKENKTGSTVFNEIVTAQATVNYADMPITDDMPAAPCDAPIRNMVSTEHDNDGQLDVQGNSKTPEVRDPLVMDPAERRRVRDRARMMALSAEQRALINQRRRENYHAKKQCSGVAEAEKNAMRNQHRRGAYQAKKQQGTTAVKGQPISGAERAELEEICRTDDDDADELPTSHTTKRHRVTSGERQSLISRRNREFEALIGRNTHGGVTPEPTNEHLQQTQSTVVNEGADADAAYTIKQMEQINVGSDSARAGTHQSNHDTQASIVEDCNQLDITL